MRKRNLSISTHHYSPKSRIWSAYYIFDFERINKLLSLKNDSEQSSVGINR